MTTSKSKPAVVFRGRARARQGRAPSSKHPQSVEDYIALAPKETQTKLRRFRAIIKDVAPMASESVSYQMPFYSYKGQLAWFALAPRRSYIGLYLRPPVIEDHRDELKGYVTTKSAIHFPLDTEIPTALVKKLVRARMRMNEAE